MEIKRICEKYTGSSLWGMNGGLPESPDGKLLVYARKCVIDDPAKRETEIWIAERETPEHAHKLFTVQCGNHNGPSATFVDNEHIVFRDEIGGLSAFRIVNVYSGKTIIGPVFAKESHRAECGLYAFSVSQEFLGKNPDHPEIDRCGIYLLHLSSGQITRVADKDTVFNMVTSHQCIPNAKTTSMSHVQLSPDGKKVMMRLSVDNCPVFGALGCIHLERGETYVIPDKPVHQLWYDSDTYMATRQYVVNGKIDMASSRIQRFSMSGECLETLGGIANHIDASPNRQWFTGDRAYPGYPCDIFLYRRGCTEPALTFGTSNYQTCIWKHQIHANPTFSLDGKRIYFNYAADEDRAEACYIDISSIVG